MTNPLSLDAFDEVVQNDEKRNGRDEPVSENANSDTPHTSRIVGGTSQDEEIDKIFDKWRGEMLTKGFGSPSSANRIDAEARAAIQAMVVEAKLKCVDDVFRLSPKGSFNQWKPVDALLFYERLKDYERQLKDHKKGLEA